MFDGGIVSMIGYNIGLSEARGARGRVVGRRRRSGAAPVPAAGQWWGREGM